MEQVRALEQRVVVVAGGEDPLILSALNKAGELGLVQPILVGERRAMEKCCQELALPDWRHIDSQSDRVAELAVKTAREHPGSLLIKGRVSTAELMKAILNRRTGIRGEHLLSHVVAAETPGYHKLLFITDGAINLQPDSDTLEAIARNAINFVRTLGIDQPRTAMIALIETINPKITSTVRAAEVTRRIVNNELIEGPISLDIALSEKAAQQKGVNSKIAGQTDILVMPNATACNVVVKALRLVGGAKIGGVVVGAQIPILLVSRSDDANSNLRSIALGIAYQEKLLAQT